MFVFAVEAEAVNNNAMQYSIIFNQHEKCYKNGTNKIVSRQ